MRRERRVQTPPGSQWGRRGGGDGQALSVRAKLTSARAVSGWSVPWVASRTSATCVRVGTEQRHSDGLAAANPGRAPRRQAQQHKDEGPYLLEEARRLGQVAKNPVEVAEVVVASHSPDVVVREARAALDEAACHDQCILGHVEEAEVDVGLTEEKLKVDVFGVLWAETSRYQLYAGIRFSNRFFKVTLAQ